MKCSLFDMSTLIEVIWSNNIQFKQISNNTSTLFNITAVDDAVGYFRPKKVVNLTIVS